MITVKGIELEPILQALMKLTQVNLEGVPKRARISYVIVKAIREIQAELKLFEEARLKLIKDFSRNGKPETNPETKQYILTDMDAYMTVFRELQSQDIELNIDKIPIKIPEELEIDPVPLEALMWLAENDDIFIDNKPNITILGETQTEA